MKNPGDNLNYELYLGSDAQQEAVIEKLNAAIESGKPATHLVSGGTGSGKSSAINAALEGLEGNAKFKPLVTPEDIEEGHITHAAQLPPRLVELLLAMSDEESRTYVQHHVFKHKDKELYVVVADGETAPREERDRVFIRAAAGLVRDLAAEGTQVVWIADAPIMHQSASVFKPNTAATKSLKEHEQAVAMLQKEYKGIVQAHTLHYDPANIRESLWEHITDKSPEGGTTFLTYLEKSGHWDKTPEWKAAKDAALAGDREAYDDAFDVLAKRAEAGKKKAKS